MVCKVPGGTEGEQVKGVRCVLWKPWGTPVTPLDFKFFLSERGKVPPFPSGVYDLGWQEFCMNNFLVEL